ncbi:MAG: XRE family transcriptional regulator [Desulfobacterales bacterium]|nr:XRE family transcriptional regulator [Desulfobacterales bacterium]
MPAELQKNIKKFRTKKKLTLEKLAQKAGCSKAYISQVEKGVTAPSVSMLGKLAKGLDVQVADLFRGKDVSDGKECCLRKADRRKIEYPDGKTTSQLLTSEIFLKKMQPLISTIKPGGASDLSEKITHIPGSEEFVFVLKGEVEFEINAHQIKLREGDTLYFNGDIPHHWVNSSNKIAKVLFVFTPPIW